MEINPTQPRSITLPVSVADDAQYRRVIGSIRQVRAAARQAFAVVFSAQAAGADLQTDADGNLTVAPNNARARAILAAMMDKDGKAPLYALRPYVLEHLLPTSYSFVWDDLRQFVWARWKAKDAEFPRAGRGWLALQNVRGLAMFRGSGIGFPTTVLAQGALQPHAVTLTWDREIGPVTFDIGTLDPGRWAVWRRIHEGETQHGTVTLNERDGKLRLTISYHHPIAHADVDRSRTLTVRMTEAGDALAIVGPDGERTYDRIDLHEVVGWLDRLSMQQKKWADRQASCGSPRRAWGEPRRFRGVVAHRERVTRTREQGGRSRNHAWAKRVATRALHWRCGGVMMDIPATATIGGHSWPWADLRGKIGYKLAAFGATVLKGSPSATATA